MVELVVDGMHCEACRTLMRMEVEENGLEEKLKDIELLDGNKGILRFDGLTNTEQELFSKSINSLGNYKVIENIN